LASGKEAILSADVRCRGALFRFIENPLPAQAIAIAVRNASERRRWSKLEEWLAASETS
jgi:hypothetical protein